MVDGVCRLVSPTSLAGMTAKAKISAAKEAEAFLEQVRKCCKDMKLDRMAVMKCIGKADVRVVCFLTKKGKDSAEKRVFNSITEIAEALQRHLLPPPLTPSPL